MIQSNGGTGFLNVRITKDKSVKDAGNWVPLMDSTMGMEGEVIEIDVDGDARVQLPCGVAWWYKPNQLLLVEPSPPTQVSSFLCSLFLPATKLIFLFFPRDGFSSF